MSAMDGAAGSVGDLFGLWSSLPRDKQEQVLDIFQRLGETMGGEMPPEVAGALRNRDVGGLLGRLQGMDLVALGPLVQQVIQDPAMAATLQQIGRMFRGPQSG